MMMRKSVAAMAICGLVMAGVAGFGSATAQQEKAKAKAKTKKHEHEKVEAKVKAKPVTEAIASLIPTKGSDVKGWVKFTRKGDKVEVRAEVSGLTPGDHGFHIHEYGVWSEDGMASGGHYNPTDMPHAGHDAHERHVGDFGNITAGENGVATLVLEDSGVRFQGPTSILGRGVVVHEKADDLKSQPSGDAGARLAVGVIGVAKPSEVEHQQ